MTWVEVCASREWAGQGALVHRGNYASLCKSKYENMNGLVRRVPTGSVASCWIRRRYSSKCGDFESSSKYRFSMSIEPPSSSSRRGSPSLSGKGGGTGSSSSTVAMCDGLTGGFTGEPLAVGGAATLDIFLLRFSAFVMLFSVGSSGRGREKFGALSSDWGT